MVTSFKLKGLEILFSFLFLKTLSLDFGKIFVSRDAKKGNGEGKDCCPKRKWMEHPILPTQDVNHPRD